MYINTEKTKALLVTGKRLQHKLSEETATLKLRLDANNIDQLSHRKLLGLIMILALKHAWMNYVRNCQKDLDF